MAQIFARAGAFSVTQFILSFCFYLSLIRGTNIGLFYPPDEFLLASIDYTTQTIMNFTLLVGMIAYFFLQNNYAFFVRSLAQRTIALIAGGILISLVFSVDVVQSVKFTVAILAITLPAVLYYQNFGPDQLMRALTRFVVVMAYVNLAYVLALPQYGIMVERHAGRWRGMFEHKNFAGPFFALGFFMIFYNVTLRKIMPLAVMGGAMLICLAFIIMSQSSTALVAFVLMGAFYAALSYGFQMRHPKDRVVIFLFLVSVTTLVFTFFGSDIEAFFFALTGKDATLTGRTGIWKVILDLVAERPLIGFGPGMSERPEFMDRIQGAVGWDAKGTHNSYLDLLINYGYPTTIVMMACVLGIWWRYFVSGLVDPAGRRIGAYASCLILTVLVIGGANAASLFSRSVLWIFVVAGLLVLNGQLKNQSLKNNT